ncbi:type 2 isopentenyl-diphosphate Delta-isomerase [Deinococcus roseus]|uniref:Isopentenyl-diphosphate delta-isomerase n=1 Tax=Deinococcus roseus TaxID=392414 RepID=A0ABQ2D134_9DEIO|nr:type 2 isopentenyl-diphosphate Delta-isomerase [Deinococcus roseus]GGJ40367.1 isopentenyl-diphosphate delta-isomerase [Deinococcus roseus]
MTMQERKLKHLEACLREDSQYQTISTGLERVSWPYQALPEVNLNDIDLRCTFLGKPLSAPLLIGAMTGGTEHAARINRNLALAAQELGIGMMLGSQRVMLEHPEASYSFHVREHAPDILLIGNLGVAQFLKGYTASHIIKAIGAIKADGLALHTNPLQEAVQVGGDTNFQGITEVLAGLVKKSWFPIMLKEVGHGIGQATAERIKHIPFAAIDVAGAGGTSWAKVEDLVANGSITQPDLGEIGIPTAQALQETRHVLPQMPLVASGGIRSGLDIAKCLMLGAQVCAIARPLIQPALLGPDAVLMYLLKIIQQLRTALFVAGISSVSHLTQLEPAAPPPPPSYLVDD